MKQEIRSVLAAVATVLASLPWGGILTGGFALLGTAGSAAATVVTGWLSPLLLCLSLLLMGRSFYVIYVRKIRTRATVAVTWLSLTFMVGFWTWFLVSGGWGPRARAVEPDESQLMWMRVYFGVALCCSLLVLTGCGSRTGSAQSKTPGKAVRVGDGHSVTLHVEGMTRRLKLTGLDGPNKVYEALSGLPGVEVVEVDLDNDRLQVYYDPAKLTAPDMLQLVAQQGFVATVVGGGGQAPPPGFPLP